MWKQQSNGLPFYLVWLLSVDNQEHWGLMRHRYLVPTMFQLAYIPHAPNHRVIVDTKNIVGTFDSCTWKRHHEDVERRLVNLIGTLCLEHRNIVVLLTSP